MELSARRYEEDLGVEDLFAERAAVQLVSVDVDEVLLEVLGSGEQLETACAAVLGRQAEIVCRRDVRLQIIVAVKRHRTFAACCRRGGRRRSRQRHRRVATWTRRHVVTSTTHSNCRCSRPPVMERTG